MFVDTTNRTDAPEIMDDFSVNGSLLHEALDKIAQINRLLGGNSITRDGVSQLIRNMPKDEQVVIADMGCGNGDMLRALADYAISENRQMKLIGVDANLHTITYARKLSKDYPNISFVHLDIFSPELAQLDYDIALCTLTLHHFGENEVILLLAQLRNKARLGVVINDLHRHALAYYLFRMIGIVFNLPALPRKDGLVSILRGFKRTDLERFAKKLQLKHYTIRWKWAFRYQWIIPKL